MIIVDYLVTFFVRSFIGLINVLPVKMRLSIFKGIARAVLFFMPAFKNISLKNLRLVFPKKSEEELHGIYEKSIDNLARVFVDFARLPTLGPAWVKEHVSCPMLPRFVELKKIHPGKGILLATGHVGSFELLAHSIAMFGYPVSFIVRNFTLPRFDAWWTSQREAYGNQVIPRTGAVKVVLKNLQEGKDVALLFDQNVKQNHAVFVNHFGRLAATTMTLGLTAVRTEAPIIVSTIKYVGNDRYEIVAEECDCFDIYRREDLSLDEKIRMVTERATRLFEPMIEKYPEGWFWMHRRWKTAPAGQREDFYK